MAERNSKERTQTVEYRPASDEASETPRATAEGPLDGSTSGTIGGGGPDTGGPTARSKAPDLPPVKPENAASGRLAPDPLAATHQPDPTKTSSGDSQPR